MYDEQLKTDRAGAALNLIFPIKYTKSGMFSILLIGEYLREQANIDFYTSEVSSIMVGFSWRHIRR